MALSGQNWSPFLQWMIILFRFFNRNGIAKRGRRMEWLFFRFPIMKTKQHLEEMQQPDENNNQTVNVQGFSALDGDGGIGDS